MGRIVLGWVLGIFWYFGLAGDLSELEDIGSN